METDGEFMAQESATVAERMQAKFDSLTAAEKRAARTLMSDYPVAGLDTAQSFAELSRVSPATIVRFVKSLGFESFRQFQESLRTEVKERQASALSQATEPRTASEQSPEALVVGTTVFTAMRDAFVGGIERTFEAQRRSEYQKVVDWLADPKRRIVAAGGTFSGLLAQHLVAQLTLFRSGVVECPEGGMKRAALLLDARSGSDVWVLIDFRRYQNSTLALAHEARNRGVRLALITDRWLSPVASIADAVLIASVEASGPSDSLVPGLALVEALCELASDRIGPTGLAKLQQLDPIRLRLE